jgi:hypothetical protein
MPESINSIHRDLQATLHKVENLEREKYTFTSDQEFEQLSLLVKTAINLSWQIGNENEVTG